MHCLYFIIIYYFSFVNTFFINCAIKCKLFLFFIILFFCIIFKIMLYFTKKLCYYINRIEIYAGRCRSGDSEGGVWKLFSAQHYNKIKNSPTRPPLPILYTDSFLLSSLFLYNYLNFFLDSAMRFCYNVRMTMRIFFRDFFKSRLRACAGVGVPVWRFNIEIQSIRRFNFPMEIQWRFNCAIKCTGDSNSRAIEIQFAYL